ncbi:hypothetical protein FO519_006496 [Halicephalobus sp. NKZ332]|nr:hypothetical protein FO519_006496 [Halicephalobus sp. NKZ332]
MTATVEEPNGLLFGESKNGTSTNGHNVKTEVSSQLNNNTHKHEPMDVDIKEEPHDKISTPKKSSTKAKKVNKRKYESEDEEEEYKSESPQDDEEDEYKPVKKDKSKKDSKKEKDSKRKSKDVKAEKLEIASPPAKRRKKEEEEEIWKWWEEDKKPDGVKWNTLIHSGPLFAPAYEPLPKSVKFRYDKEVIHLSESAEEVAYFYACMLDHEYTSKTTFNNNFFKDWRKTMNSAEREKIKDLSKCDFKPMHEHFISERETRRNMSKEEKQKLKELREKEVAQYGTAVVDGHKQKIANFRTEPPGLFRGRGDHPKMGCLKRRVMPEDVIINCSKGNNVPAPPAGHKWKEVRHDNTVSWLCSWTENVLGQNKYVMLNPSSKLKGEKDFEKFEKARSLAKIIDDVRTRYTEEFKSKEMRIRQRATALYFIDRLALRAGNEKDTDEVADTVGCCSLRCEHVTLHDELDGKKYVVEFDFLGKDSIRYQNQVPVEKKVFKNLKKFMEGKEGSDDLFDRLNTSTLNDHLKDIMPGLTAKVFRTYNASWTLQQQLQKLTTSGDTVHEKMLSYNRANRQRLKDQLKRLKTTQTDKDENKQIALSTSKLNYLDPRISVAWCRKYNVPIEKVYNKTQREKFRWAIDMTQDGSFVF